MHKGQYCCGIGVVAHLFSIAGIYLLTWGLIGSAKIWTVIRSPIFWGLILIAVGFHRFGTTRGFQSTAKTPKKK